MSSENLRNGPNENGFLMRFFVAGSRRPRFCRTPDAVPRRQGTAGPDANRPRAWREFRYAEILSASVVRGHGFGDLTDELNAGVARVRASATVIDRLSIFWRLCPRRPHGSEARSYSSRKSASQPRTAARVTSSARPAPPATLSREIVLTCSDIAHERRSRSAPITSM